MALKVLDLVTDLRPRSVHTCFLFYSLNAKTLVVFIYQDYIAAFLKKGFGKTYLDKWALLYNCVDIHHYMLSTLGATRVELYVVHVRDTTLQLLYDLKRCIDVFLLLSVERKVSCRYTRL